MVRTWRLWCLTACCLTVAAMARSADAPTNPVSGTRLPGGAVKQIGATPDTQLREGTELLDEPGQFRDTGERVIFESRQRKLEFTVLENLALERIMTMVKERVDSRTWIVSGTVTQFHGGNYLLVTRALQRAPRARNPLPATAAAEQKKP